MKANEVKKLLGITQHTLYRYLKSGKVKLNAKISSTFYDYDEDSIYALIGQKSQKKNKIIVSYARVSKQSQKAQLDKQNQMIYDSCISKGLKLVKQFSDIQSGLSIDRKQFQEMLKLIIQGEVEIVVIENKDRLIRFEYDVLEHIFKYFGCKILVLNDVIDNKEYEQELTDDLISIIYELNKRNYSYKRDLNALRRVLEKKSSDIDED